MTKHDMDKLNPPYESVLFVYLTLYQRNRGCLAMPQSSLKVTLVGVGCISDMIIVQGVAGCGWRV
jgi:hypothetical protein